MGRFSDLAKQYLAVLDRVTGFKKEKSEHDTELDTKVDAKVDTKADCYRCFCHGLEAPTAPEPKRTVGFKKGWHHRRNAEFPWRLVQVVDREENWRGTWVLDVKDMGAMNWGSTLVPKTDGKGRGGRYQRQPTRHFPFPPDGDRYRESLTGGQDDMMVYLGKP
ncbi:hypothetical protein BDP81DRAFT_108619 [Colletotrichum phormii]|uniref:Uncharacterized protein n=1 Tax=Colletotrichum phormii TaxID=359342 RepID=A0AAI9ZHH0_9PEZI|nr:uncharacterized protein BDP81DRAFT_108619 [Colletotrichum phormii]KAK1624367.1 hypothetical protein BDP81DRAFT_108619 [Colletotrichum phormii]